MADVQLGKVRRTLLKLQRAGFDPRAFFHFHVDGMLLECQLACHVPAEIFCVYRL